MPDAPARDDLTVTAAWPGLPGVLQTLEAVLLRGSHVVARRNAWISVQEDRRRARARREAEHVLEATAEGTSPAT
ncbi:MULTISPECIES: hypothetical protein [unclassified Streptomyces]|uniref:hypothetical protein n=1 Tax=unclassified Streptomyces TaxID=2593676 RepID=UPI0022B7153F|nr:MULTISPECIES: hypothetical protein [unclassified Streptomyces]MCZ7413952.1 hypothetical protein [Streptomyces sp. WMMC897]MCZ7430948.1 hypothetical protein [Streptomyces sp. WMMC1477]